MTELIPSTRERPVSDIPSARARATREAITLPALFLTVAMGGGFRATTEGQFLFVPPSLMFLMLALLLMAVLVRSSVLVPDALIGGNRTPMSSASGAVVALTLFGASAQLLNAVTPHAGLLHVLALVLIVFLLVNTFTMAPGPARALQSLFATCGGLLVLKYVVLAALADPEAGLARRLLAVLLEGITLGELQLEPSAPLTGYVAFAVYLLYFVGLLLLKSIASEYRQRVSRPALLE